MKSELKKDKIFWQAMTLVFRFEVTQGHLQWRITDIARQLKVSRALVYHYLGSSKKEILKLAIQVITDDFYGFSSERQKYFAENGFIKSVLLSKKFVESHPEMMAFYYQWRHSENKELVQQLVAIEERYEKRLKTLFPKMTEPQFVTLRAALHGFVVAPFLNEKEVEKALHKLLSEFN